MKFITKNFEGAEFLSKFQNSTSELRRKNVLLFGYHNIYVL